MPRGASPKRERAYRKLEEQFVAEGRYRGREEEVASRIVNKQRRQFGQTKREQQQEREGQSPDRHLPVAQYRQRTKAQLIEKLKHLSRGEVMKLIDYEKQHKKRKTVLQQYNRALNQK